MTGYKFKRLTRNEWIDGLVNQNLELFDHLMEMHGDTPHQAAKIVLDALADAMRRMIPPET